jgi:hypothetical protein
VTEPAMQEPTPETPRERRAELDRRAAIVVAATHHMPMQLRIRVAKRLLLEHAKLPTGAAWDAEFARWEAEERERIESASLSVVPGRSGRRLLSTDPDGWDEP